MSSNMVLIFVKQSHRMIFPYSCTTAKKYTERVLISNWRLTPDPTSNFFVNKKAMLMSQLKNVLSDKICCLLSEQGKVQWETNQPCLSLINWRSFVLYIALICYLIIAISFTFFCPTSRRMLMTFPSYEPFLFNVFFFFTFLWVEFSQVYHATKLYNHKLCSLMLLIGIPLGQLFLFKNKDSQDNFLLKLDYKILKMYFGWKRSNRFNEREDKGAW